ncbi:HK97 family phage prohead protease [Sphingomonas aerophila]|uniref:Prohead serine protease domain-containing protein n=1 Tax=Sphingomonas aerophila TaxID=1344948 RepID=A0A7W9BEQ2_9SPHN|nr:hypothetical protein [Sphingomonas aerophila]
MNPIEQKAVTRLECKFATTDVDTDTKVFSGYGAVFGNVDSYGDVIAPGAFAKSLAAHKSAGTSPLMFLNHDAFGSLPIGRWTEMSEDGYGLKVSGELLDTSMGRDTYVALKAGAITGLSIGFRPVAFDMRSKPEDPRRTLKEVDLVEVSVVTLPANQKARVQAVKSMGEDMSVRDLEQLLRECGLSKSEAIAVASQFESKNEIAATAEMNAALTKLQSAMRF